MTFELFGCEFIRDDGFGWIAGVWFFTFRTWENYGYRSFLGIHRQYGKWTIDVLWCRVIGG
jgi:hypothetical protein